MNESESDNEKIQKGKEGTKICEREHERKPNKREF